MAIIEVSKQITNYLDSEEMVTAPANPVEGQRWTDTSKSPPVAMIYKDGEWKPERLSVEVLDPDFYQDLEDTKTEVAAAIEKAEAADKAGKDAQAAGEAAQSAASEAKLAGENAANLATQATLDAQAAKDKADAIQIDVNGLVSDVATINGTVTAISSKANEAYDKAAAVEGRTATLETSVTGLTGRMTDIETTSTSTTKKLNELVLTVDGQKQTIATTTTTANSALNKANVLETTVDGVTQTLTSVEEWQDNLSIGVRNYFSVEAWNSKPPLTINAIPYMDIKLEPNTQYTLSTNIPSRDNLCDVFFLKGTDTPSSSVNGVAKDLPRTLTTNADGVVKVALRDYDLSNGYWIMLSKGTKTSDWSPAPEDIATVSKVNQIESTVDGTIQTISSVKNTADSALSKANQVEVTANGLKTTISSVETTANSALIKATQVEQTADGLVTTVNRIDGGGTNLVSNGGFENDYVGWTQPSGFTITTSESHSGSKSLAVSNVGSAGRAIGRRINVPVVPGRKYEVSYWYKTTADANGVSGNQKLRIGQTNGTLINALGWDGASTEWSQKSQIYTAGTSIFEWSIALTASHTVGTVWWDDISIVDVTDREATASQITQLSDKINLKVSKGEVVNQINVSTEGILIAGNKLNITAQTTIDNAVIKTAHIADLAVSNGKIANLAVTEGKIGNLAVTTAKIADLAVNNAKIASLDAAKINTGYLAAARIAASSITTDKLNVATLSAITANLGNVTAGTINGLEIIGGSYTQSATMTDPNSGKSGISEIKLASGILTNSFNSTDSSVSRQTTLSSGVLRFLNLGSEFGRLQSNSDKGSSTVPALEISGTFMAITSSQRGWINLSANGIFEGNTYRGYSVDAGSNTGNYVGFNRNSSDKMNFFAGKTADGTKRMGSDDLYASSGSGKALHITSGGSIVAYSSSERFKEYIETAADVTPKLLLNLDLKSWIYKSSHSLVSVGEPIRRVYGLIAEDVERVGLNQYVERDINGRVEGYKPELWTVTIPILKEHEESIETLKQKVQKLEEKIEALQAA